MCPIFMTLSTTLQTILPKSVLVVEADPRAADTLRLLLTNNRHRVEVVQDGQTALAMHAAGRYDLVITDLSIPGMDGLELIRSIKERLPRFAPILLEKAA